MADFVQIYKKRRGGGPSFSLFDDELLRRWCSHDPLYRLADLPCPICRQPGAVGLRPASRG